MNERVSWNLPWRLNHPIKFIVMLVLNVGKQMMKLMVTGIYGGGGEYVFNENFTIMIVILLVKKI